MRLFNTLSRSVEPVAVPESQAASVYTCGPTVYNSQHIGNYRTFITEDVLIKTLRYIGYPVRHVMNITDVGHLTSDEDEGEDKLEVGARREGKTAWEVARQYEQEFLDDLEELRIAKPDVLVRATDTISEQIELIQELERKGFTYRISDGLYFDTGKLDRYGELARLDVAGLQAGARVEHSTEKRHITDFALWKFSPNDRRRDMEWESPWGTGFPGWHVECSAIIKATIGDTVTIHAGGVDHIPVHHTNEIAQSESVTGKPLAGHWMHGEFLLVEGQKMSKSLGNVFTVRDLKERGFDPLAFRLLTYSATYRSKLNFTWEGLRSAQAKLEELRASMQEWDGGADCDALSEEAVAIRQRMRRALLNDLHLPNVLAEVYAVASSELTPGEKHALLLEVDQILSLDLSRPPRQIEVPEEVQALFEARQKARLEKDFQRSDLLRQQIEDKGFVIEDKPDKSTIRAKNS